MSTPNYTYNARVIRVVDGDTIIAEADLGFDIWKKVNIRLYGINTPETRTKDLEEKAAGQKAKGRLIELLEANDNNFVLQSMGVDKDGRSLGVLWTGYHLIDTYADTSGQRPVEISLNNLLIEEGLAVEYFGGKR